MHSRQWNIGLGLLFVVASAVTLLWWIPTDVESGVLLEERRSVVIGDAMAPTMAALGILLISTALTLSALFGPAPAKEDTVEYTVGLSIDNWRNVATSAAIIAVSLACMVWGGPLIVKLLQGLGFALPEYRLLIDTIPYKYMGFAIGGFFLVLALIWWIEGRFRARAALTAAGAVIVLIVIYDVPFDTLLLPPNGSQ